MKRSSSLRGEHGIIVVSDNAYSEISLTDTGHLPSLRQDGASEVGIEMHSLSKTYNMTGWRIGMAVGNQEVIKGLGIVKPNIDSGVFNPVQYAAIAALPGPRTVYLMRVGSIRKGGMFLCRVLKSWGLISTHRRQLFILVACI